MYTLTILNPSIVSANPIEHEAEYATLEEAETEAARWIGHDIAEISDADGQTVALYSHGKRVGLV